MRCSKQQLKHLYLDEQLSSGEIAYQLAIPRATISWELKRFSIPLRHCGTRNGRHNSPATEFKKGYHYFPEGEFKKGQRAGGVGWNKGLTRETCLSIMEGAKKTSKRLKGRKPTHNKYACSKEFYENLYYKEGLSLGTIARKVGCSTGTVVYYFKKYGIPRRNRAAQLKPTEPERKLSEIMERYNFPFKYVGNGKVIIDKLCPDFINTDGNKQIVELFGDYWHTGAVKRWDQFEGSRIYHYAKFGFATLIIWESELSNESKVARKIRQFTQRLPEKVLDC